MKQSVPVPTFLSAPKAAKLCGVSRNTICSWIRNKKLNSYRTAGGNYLIRPTDLKIFMEDYRMFVPQTLIQLAAEDEPTTASTPQAEQARTSIGSTEKPRPLIILCDPDEQARMMAARALKNLKVRVLCAEDSYEVMHLLLKHPETALIATDINGNMMDGNRTFQEIRRINNSVPVFFISDFLPTNEEVNAEFQPNLVITKPYQPSHLMSAVQHALNL